MLDFSKVTMADMERIESQYTNVKVSLSTNLMQISCCGDYVLFIRKEGTIDVHGSMPALMSLEIANLVKKMMEV